MNHPVEVKIHLNKFKPRDYQLPIFKAFFEDKFRRMVICMCRRSGKDLCTWNIVIREAITFPGVYYLVYPTYSQGKKILWSSVTIQGERFLDYIPKQLIEGTNSQEMKVVLTNGSIIQIIGSENPDSIVGTNPRGVVFSEYALQNPIIYALMAPILAANKGWAIFQSCVSPETLVITEQGLSRIKDISSVRTEYSDLNKPIYGLGGFNNATDFYYGGVQNTLKITLANGFMIECTPIHPLWNGTEWVKSKDIKVGDLFPVQYGQQVFGKGLDVSGFKNSDHPSALRYITKESLDDDLFYLLGLIHADGKYRGPQITITNKKDQEILNFIELYGFMLQQSGIHHQLTSINLASFLEFLGFKHWTKNKEWPDKLFECSKSQLRSFIQGLFDGDGTSNSNPSKRGNITFTSMCRSFIRDLQTVLLNFGIVSSVHMEEKAPTNKVSVWSMLYNLEITDYFAHVFYEQIGFRLGRKQQNKKYIPESVKVGSGNSYPAESLFFSPVSSIEASTSEVFDFVVPSTHSFFGSGFVNHNTPRGKNHFWDIYNLAKNSPEWWCCRLGLDETRHIDPKEIDREIAEGLMSPDLVQQEYYCSWSAGVEGSYYCKYIDRMRLNNQIGVVPWESGFKVHTAWDIGVRDSTSIIFFQVIGQTVRVIDYYEKNKEGLEHYVNYVLSKDYTYGKHIAPHDIAVKEFGSGVTRIEKAKQLGISFTVASKISIMDGIETVRSSLSKIWIDDQRCTKLIRALENYRQEYDSKRQVYKDVPLHDVYSHAADCMRYLCVSLPKTRDSLSANDLEKIRRDAMYGDESSMPDFFRDGGRKF